MRKNIELEERNYSTENNASRFSISKDDDESSLNSNNSFLHDNVD